VTASNSSKTINVCALLGTTGRATRSNYSARGALKTQAQILLSLPGSDPGQSRTPGLWLRLT